MTNKEDAAIQVVFANGALWTTKDLPEDAPAYQGIVRNLTAVQYSLEIEPGETKSIPYSFALDMMPQDVRLRLLAVFTNDKGDIFQVPAYDGETSIVEAPTSFLDPQMYVNMILADFYYIWALTLARLQHLPLPRSHGRLRRHPLLRLQDLDRGALPPGQAPSHRQEARPEAH